MTTDRALPPMLLLAVLGLGIALTIAVIPGVFIIDDNNYLVNVLALRHGRVTIANTEGLPPSRELLFFDPTARSRPVTSTPVASTAPPLYAFLALPFSGLGWRGLVALNTLAYLATILIVFCYTARYATAPFTAWLAAGTFAFGGYAIEYALGLWPQALSFALCIAGIAVAGRVIEDGRITLAATAGFLLAVAAGVRYQNAVVLAAVGAGIVLWTPRRWRAAAAFTAAAALPMIVSAVLNHARFGSWNPISKGPGYIDVPVVRGAESMFNPLVMFWGQVVDYSARPELTGPDVQSWLQRDPTTGAHLIFGVIVKKALLQSAPWAVLAFLFFGAAWIPRVQVPAGHRRQIRLLSLVVAAVLAVFSLASVNTHEGLAFNGRYLLELLPLLSVGFAWALDRRGLTAREVGIGAALGCALVLAIVLGTPMVGGPEVAAWLMRQVALLKVPLVLALVLATLWIFRRADGLPSRLLSAVAGLCLGWGLMIHLGTDVLMSQAMRRENLRRTRALEAVLPDDSAVIGHRGGKDAVVPLLFGRNIVILDAWADDGRDAPTLIRQVFARRRRVFLLEDGFSQSLLGRVTVQLHVTRVAGSSLPILELGVGQVGSLSRQPAVRRADGRLFGAARSCASSC